LVKLSRIQGAFFDVIDMMFRNNSEEAKTIKNAARAENRLSTIISEANKAWNAFGNGKYKSHKFSAASSLIKRAIQEEKEHLQALHCEH
jgi:hypothetical protein